MMMGADDGIRTRNADYLRCHWKTRDDHFPRKLKGRLKQAESLLPFGRDVEFPHCVLLGPGISPLQHGRLSNLEYA